MNIKQTSDNVKIEFQVEIITSLGMILRILSHQNTFSSLSKVKREQEREIFFFLKEQERDYHTSEETVGSTGSSYCPDETNAVACFKIRFSSALN